MNKLGKVVEFLQYCTGDTVLKCGKTYTLKVIIMASTCRQLLLMDHRGYSNEKYYLNIVVGVRNPLIHEPSMLTVLHENLDRIDHHRYYVLSTRYDNEPNTITLQDKDSKITLDKDSEEALFQYSTLQDIDIDMINKLHPEVQDFYEYISKSEEVIATVRGFDNIDFDLIHRSIDEYMS